MAQRERHELNRRAERAARGLFEHKVILVSLLVAIAAACGMALSAVSGSSSDGVEIERGDRGSASDSDHAADQKVSPSKGRDGSDEEAYVDVDGSVRTPGVYRLTTSQRIADAIEAAGGLAEDADVSSVNRASKVIDGQKIHIPREGEVPSGGAEGSVVAGDSVAASPTGLVNINSADAAELETLPGVGPSTAQAIIDDRTQNGPFASTDDLMRVSGIGEKKFAKLQGKICI